MAPSANAGDVAPREPRFGDFEEDDVYEDLDLDRDTDYAAVYADEDLEDDLEDQDDYTADPPEETAKTASIWSFEEEADSQWQTEQEDEHEDDDSQSPSLTATPAREFPQESAI